MERLPKAVPTKLLYNSANSRNNCFVTRQIVEQGCCTWTVENFSLTGRKEGDRITSPKFLGKKGKCLWHLELYPYGESEEDKDYVSVYLVLESAPKDGIPTECTLTARDSENHNVKSVRRRFTFSVEDGFGLSRFICRNDLLTKLKNDVLRLQIDINAAVGETTIVLETEDIEQTDVKFVSDFTALFESQKLSDVIVVTGDREIPAHKAILVSRSPVFEAMFAHETLESISSRIIITDFEYDAVYELLRFIYTGRVECNNVKVAMDVLKAADKYALENLKKICGSYLITNMNTSNVVDLLLLADMHRASKLREEAVNFICKNSFLIAEKYEMFHAHKHILKEIFIKMTKD